MQLGVALVSGLAVLVAARDDPVLSPDSMTYLSAAESLRSLDGVVDFTGEPLAHFPPVFPMLLAPGGRSLVWASIVAAVCAAAIAALLFGVLATRVRTSVAVGATLVYGLSQGVVRTESNVWSETPYLMFALGTIAIVGGAGLTERRAAAAGALAAVALLTRYAGVGLVATGLIMVVVATISDSRSQRRRCLAWFVAPSAAMGSMWVARNWFATGEPFGPHFEGGANESVGLLLRLHAKALGRLVIDLDTVGDWTRPTGFIVLAGVAVAVVVTFGRRRRNVVDIGMATFAITSLAVPTLSRLVAGTDIGYRIASPMMLPVVYFVAAAFEFVLRRARQRRFVAVVGMAAATAWCAQGVVAVIDGPDRLYLSAARSRQPTAELYASVPDPAASNVLTNSPHRFWWTTGHVPTFLAFTEPKPGNSHFPLSPGATLRRACEAPTFLAWFPGLANAHDLSPGELRPDLAELVSLTVIDAAPGGSLYRLDVRDPASCEAVGIIST